MYERFTDRARKVMQLANQEAQRFNHEYIGTEHILLDLGGVEYMGSAGFRAIHAIANMLNKEQKQGMYKSEHIKLLNPKGEVARVIKTLGFDSFLEIFQDRATAIASF